MIYDFSHMLICLLWFCHEFPKGEIVRTYMIYLLGTYVTILCNWLILWQNVLYMYLGKFRMCLNTLRNHVSRSSVEALSLPKKTSWKCRITKARQLPRQLAYVEVQGSCSACVLDSCSTSPIYRGLRILEFWYDFLGIRECVFGPSFLLILDI